LVLLPVPWPTSSQRTGRHRHEGSDSSRSGVDPQAINYVTVGTTMPTDSRFAYVSRVASIQAGLSMDSVAMRSTACAPPACRPS
jgi:acetyl-CoA acetyltransferase